MTLSEILSQTLTELNRTTDAQQVEAWRGRIVPYINEGMRDLARYLQLRRTDTVTATDKTINVSDLPHACIKVVSVTQDSRDIGFRLSSFSDRISVDTDGEMQVEYRYIPTDIKNDTDVPGIPQALHRMLVTYAAYRENLANDPRRADGYRQMYEIDKRFLRKTMGEEDTYNIINVGW